MTKCILLIAAHPDDEALGCAGTLSRHTEHGDDLHLLFMTDGVSSRKTTLSSSEERWSAALNAAKILGASSITKFEFPDNEMDNVSLLKIIRKVEIKISEIKPDVIYTHHIGDLNIDHQITHKAVLTACRPQPNFGVSEIYTFEVLSSTEWQTPGYLPFSPNVFVNISEQIETKKKCLQAYDLEMRKKPHSRSIDNAINLAKVRGAQVGLSYAEAFQLIRKIN